MFKLYLFTYSYTTFNDNVQPIYKDVLQPGTSPARITRYNLAHRNYIFEYIFKSPHLLAKNKRVFVLSFRFLFAFFHRNLFHYVASLKRFPSRLEVPPTCFN